MAVVIRNIIYSININTPLSIILKYLLNYLHNLIILKKKFNKIISFQKKIKNLKAKKKIIGFTKENITYSIPIYDSIIDLLNQLKCSINLLRHAI
jgi:high-affinity nickel permease